MKNPILVAICTGTPTDYGIPGAEDPMDRPWRTAFFKYPVDGPRWLGATNVDGDAQADTQKHGGPEKAALAYSADHYRDWNREIPEVPLDFGAFAENLDIAGLSEQSVCIGDQYRIGDAVVQISQARKPCWKISWRWKVQDLTRRVQHTGRTGWYLRVLQEGAIAAGMSVELIERPNPTWSIERCNHVMHVDRKNQASAAELATLPELAEAWRTTLMARFPRIVVNRTSR